MVTLRQGTPELPRPREHEGSSCGHTKSFHNEGSTWWGLTCVSVCQCPPLHYNGSLVRAGTCLPSSTWHVEGAQSLLPSGNPSMRLGSPAPVQESEHLSMENSCLMRLSPEQVVGAKYVGSQVPPGTSHSHVTEVSKVMHVHFKSHR